MAFGLKVPRTRLWLAKGSTDRNILTTENVRDAVAYTSEARAHQVAVNLWVTSHDNFVVAKIPGSKSADRDRAMMPRRNPRDKHQHARVTAKSGKVYVVSSVSRGRKIPGWHDVDPLTVPFVERESVRRKHGEIENRKGGRLASDERAHRWESFQERHTKRNPQKRTTLSDVRLHIPAYLYNRVAIGHMPGGRAVYSENLAQYEWDGLAREFRDAGFQVHGGMMYGMPALVVTVGKSPRRNPAPRHDHTVFDVYVGSRYYGAFSTLANAKAACKIHAPREATHVRWERADLTDGTSLYVGGPGGRCMIEASNRPRR